MGKATTASGTPGLMQTMPTQPPDLGGDEGDQTNPAHGAASKEKSDIVVDWAHRHRQKDGTQPSIDLGQQGIPVATRIRG